MKQKFFILICVIFISMNISAAHKGLYCFFSDDSSYTYTDENVTVVIKGMKLHIYNNTDKVIYFDKGISFSYYNGVPTCLYSNKVYTQGQTNSSGASVNLGGVAHALGIHGAAGSILSGTNVGGGSSNQSSTTYYEQRIVTIAPNSGYIAYNWGNISSALRRLRVIQGSSYYDPVSKTKTKVKNGTDWHYNERTSPLTLKGVINYSFNEDFSNPKQATVSNYLSDVVVSNPDGIRDTPECEPYKNQYCIWIKF